MEVLSPYVDNGAPKMNPITEFVMANFGDDDAVYASFVAACIAGRVHGTNI
jgi:hypothetical protein